MRISQEEFKNADKISWDKVKFLEIILLIAGPNKGIFLK